MKKLIKIYLILCFAIASMFWYSNVAFAQNYVLNVAFVGDINLRNNIVNKVFNAPLKEDDQGNKWGIHTISGNDTCLYKFRNLDLNTNNFDNEIGYVCDIVFMVVDFSRPINVEEVINDAVKDAVGRISGNDNVKIVLIGNGNINDNQRKHLMSVKHMWSLLNHNKVGVFDFLEFNNNSNDFFRIAEGVVNLDQSQYKRQLPKEIMDWVNGINARHIITNSTTNEIRNRRYRHDNVEPSVQEGIDVLSVFPIKDHVDARNRINSIIELFCNGSELGELGDEYTPEVQNIYANSKEKVQSGRADHGLLYLYFRLLDGEGRMIDHNKAERLLACFDEQINILRNNNGIVFSESSVHELDESQYNGYAFFYMLMVVYLSMQKQNIDDIPRIILDRIARDFALKIVDGRERLTIDLINNSIKRFTDGNGCCCCSSIMNRFDNLYYATMETLLEYRRLAIKTGTLLERNLTMLNDNVNYQMSRFVTVFSQFSDQLNADINNGINNLNITVSDGVGEFNVIFGNGVNTLNANLDNQLAICNRNIDGAMRQGIRRFNDDVETHVLIPVQDVARSINNRIAPSNTLKEYFIEFASKTVANLVPIALSRCVIC